MARPLQVGGDWAAQGASQLFPAAASSGCAPAAAQGGCWALALDSQPEVPGRSTAPEAATALPGEVPDLQALVLDDLSRAQ